MIAAVLVPTKDRPEHLKRAIGTFVIAASQAGLTIGRVVVSDDSELGTPTQDAVLALGRKLPEIDFLYHAISKDIEAIKGPGNTRNEALKILADDHVHNSVIMFDDDVSFQDCVYQSKVARADGAAVLSECVRLQSLEKTIIGCGYSGRQDLSLLEHLSITKLDNSNGLVPASVVRGDVKHEAPGGISGAFLFVPQRAVNIPPFPDWYNEDYFWLQRMKRQGWHLHCSEHSIAHAPPDGLDASPASLEFEQYGEALWKATLDFLRRPTDAELRIAALASLADRIESIANVRSELAMGSNEFTKKVYFPALDTISKIFKRYSSDITDKLDHDFLKDLRKITNYIFLAGSQ